MRGFFDQNLAGDRIYALNLEIRLQEVVMKKWKPAPAKAVAAFEVATSGLAGADPRKMFGYSCVFAKGNMFAGLHEAGMVLRLGHLAFEPFEVWDHRSHRHLVQYTLNVCL
jgi:hypothetical protein